MLLVDPLHLGDLDAAPHDLRIDERLVEGQTIERIFSVGIVAPFVHPVNLGVTATGCAPGAAANSHSPATAVPRFTVTRTRMRRRAPHPPSTATTSTSATLVPPMTGAPTPGRAPTRRTFLGRHRRPASWSNSITLQCGHGAGYGSRVGPGDPQLPLRYRPEVDVTRALARLVVDEQGRRGTTGRSDRVRVTAGLDPLPPGAAEHHFVLDVRVLQNVGLVRLRFAEPSVLADPQWRAVLLGLEVEVVEDHIHREGVIESRSCGRRTHVVVVGEVVGHGRADHGISKKV